MTKYLDVVQLKTTFCVAMEIQSHYLFLFKRLNFNWEKHKSFK